MIRLSSLSKKYGDHVILDDVSLDVDKGETVVLLGPSGSGKTTLLRCINGLECPDAGSIEVDGIALHAEASRAERLERLRDIRTLCGMVFQNFILFPHLSVLGNIELAQRVVLLRRRADAEATARALLDEVGLAYAVGKPVSRLSGGEQQRVAIARALAMDPRYLLYDEPTSALDPDRAREIWAIMRRLGEGGMTQIVVTHQEDLTRAIPCRIVRMKEGRLLTVERSPGH